MFREVEKLGDEFGRLSGVPVLLGETVAAQVALVFGWDSWWAVEQEASPARTSYLEEVFSWYAALAVAGATVDSVRAIDDLRGYRAVIAPALFVASDQQLEALDRYASEGGTLVVGFLTGVLDPDLHARTGGYLGALRQTLRVWIEEFAPPAAPDLPAVGGGEPSAMAVRGDVIGERGPRHSGPNTCGWRRRTWRRSSTEVL